MLRKINRSILLIMLLWLLGGNRPVRAKQRKNDQFQFSDTLNSGKRQGCYFDLTNVTLSSEHLSELVFAATHVFEAVVTSKSEPDSNHLYGVTLKLKKSLKGDLSKHKNLDYVRMSFLSRSQDMLLSGGCAVPAVLEAGKKYLIFAREIRNRQFVPIVSPLPRTKAVIKELKRIVCQKCEPTIGKMSDIEASEGNDFQLRCVVRQQQQQQQEQQQQPLSSITFAWYKNSKLIRNTRRRKIKNKSFTEELKPKHRSILKIHNARNFDAGLYICRASLDGHIVQTEARVTIQKQSRQVKTREDGEIMEGLECPINSYCLNGGSCVYYASLGELTCICASGFRGKRCEQKDVYENGMIWGHRVSRCVLGITHFPC